MPEVNQKEIPIYLTKKLSEEIKADQEVVNLSRGEAGFLPPKEVYEEAIRNINPSDNKLFKYDKLIGSDRLRNSIASWYGRNFDLDLDTNAICATVGGTDGIRLSVQMFTNHGDEIIIPDPSYPYHTSSSQFGLDNREVTRIPIGNGMLTRKVLEDHVSDKTQLVIVTSPNNPSGVVYDKETLSGLMDLARERDFFILYDENHFPEVYDDKRNIPITLFDEKRSHSIMLGSFSRLGIQGERVGWAVLPNFCDNPAEKFSTFSPYVNTRAQRLGAFILDNYEKLDFSNFFKEYEEKRDLLVPELDKVFNCHTPQGTCYAFPNIKEFVDNHRDKLEKLIKEESEERGRSKEDIELALKHNSILVYKALLYGAKVGVIPGITYGPSSDDNLRFSFSVKKEDVIKGIERIKEYAATL